MNSTNHLVASPTPSQGSANGAVADPMTPGRQLAAQRSKLSTFYSKIKDPRSAPVRKLLEKFYEDEGFRGSDRLEQGERVQNLISDLEDKFQEIHNESPEDQLASAEGIESVVCKNLYSFIFNVEEEQEYNSKLSEKIRVHQSFVRPEHLELPASRVKIENIQVACNRLAQWNNNKVPVGKLKCLLEFMKILGAMLSETQKRGEPDGADVILPVTIYAMLQLQEGQSELLKSNLEYIRLFRHQTRIDGQDEYYLTNAESAAEFIYGMDSSTLKIDKDEYTRLYTLATTQKDQPLLDMDNPTSADLLNMDEGAATSIQMEVPSLEQQQLPLPSHIHYKEEETKVPPTSNQEEAPSTGLENYRFQDQQNKLETTTNHILSTPPPTHSHIDNSLNNEKESDISQDQQQEEDKRHLEEENIYLKKMLNKFLEGTYRYKHTTDFEDLKIRDMRVIFESALGLVKELDKITIETSEIKKEKAKPPQIPTLNFSQMQNLQNDPFDYSDFLSAPQQQVNGGNGVQPQQPASVDLLDFLNQ